MEFALRTLPIPVVIFRLAVKFIIILTVWSEPAHGQEQYAGRDFQLKPTNTYIPQLSPLQINVEKLNRVISAKLQDVSLKEALEVITAKAGLQLSTATWEVLSEKTVTLDLKNVTLLDALHEATRGTWVQFKISPTGHLIVTQALELAPLPEPVPPVKPATGTITGRLVEDGNGGPLSGGNVVIRGTTMGTAADPEGEFWLSNIPAGPQTLTFSFLGFKTKDAEVVVTPNQMVEVEIHLQSEVLESGEIIVQGLREGQVRAIAQKRQSANLKEVLSADAIGKLPDQNVAEAIRRIPGLTIQTDRGEGRFIAIRGTEPNLNTVTLNGQSLASTAESRATALDLLPAEMVDNIEVIKAVTPDMDGDAIGGTINVNTLSAFDRPGNFFFGSLNGLLHEQQIDYGDRKLPYNAHLTAGRRFGAHGQFGLVVSGSASRRDYKAVQANPDFWRPYGAFFVPEKYETELEDTRRSRYGVNANLDYHPAPGTSVYLRTYYSRTDERDDYAEYIFDLAEGELLDQTPTSGRFTESSGELDLELTKEDEYLYAVTLGGERRFGSLTLDASGTYTRGSLDRFTEKPEFTSGKQVSFASRYNIGPDFTTISFDNPEAVRNAANYVWNEIDLEYESNAENTYTFETDVRWDLSRDVNNGFLQGGIKIRRRTKTIDDLERGWTGGAEPLDLSINSLTPPTGFPYGAMMPVLGHTRTLFDTFYEAQNNPLYFDFDESETVLAGVEHDSDNEESVYAGYLMGSARLGRLSVLAGFRVERTAVRSRRWQLTLDAVTEKEDVSTQTYANSYTNFLPSIHLKYDATDHLVFRGAWSNTLGRPEYEELAGFREFEYKQVGEGVYEGSVDESNPYLEPFEAMNFDATAEYYFGLGGLLSIGGFHKIINNPIYKWQHSARDLTYENLFFEEIGFQQDRNADTGTINGLEAAYEQLFLFLPRPLNGFGVSANVSWIHSRVTVPGREHEDLPFFDQSDFIYNITPYFQRGNVELRMAISFQSAYLTDLGEETYLDRYFDDRFTIDLTGSYGFSKGRYKLTAQVRNLTNAPERAFEGVRSHYRKYILTGRTFMLGVSTSL